MVQRAGFTIKDINTYDKIDMNLIKKVSSWLDMGPNIILWGSK